jgi:hypothetical protein
MPGISEKLQDVSTSRSVLSLLAEHIALPAKHDLASNCLRLENQA